MLAKIPFLVVFSIDVFASLTAFIKRDLLACFDGGTDGLKMIFYQVILRTFMRYCHTLNLSFQISIVMYSQQAILLLSMANFE